MSEGQWNKVRLALSKRLCPKTGRHLPLILERTLLEALPGKRLLKTTKRNVL